MVDLCLILEYIQAIYHESMKDVPLNIRDILMALGPLRSWDVFAR